MDLEMRMCIIELALEFSRTMTQANRLKAGRSFSNCRPLFEIAAKCEGKFDYLTGLSFLSCDEYGRLTDELMEHQSVVFRRVVEQ